MADAQSTQSVSTGAQLRALLFAAERPVEIDVDLAGSYHVRCGDVRTCASTISEALRLALAEITGDVITMLDAMHRARVRLPEGGLGTLHRVTTRSRMATVRTDEGRWRHLPARCLTVLDSAITRSDCATIAEA